MGKFLLLLGPSAVGKSTLIKALLQVDERFVYISPDTTRQLREGETDKRSVTDFEMDALEEAGAYLAINTLFNGIRYATPRKPILAALQQRNFPVLDWPIQKLSIISREFPVYTVYVAPPSLNELRSRLGNDDRDADGTRYEAAQVELLDYWNGEFAHLIDLNVVAKTGEVQNTAQQIYEAFLKAVTSAG